MTTNTSIERKILTVFLAKLTSIFDEYRAAAQQIVAEIGETTNISPQIISKINDARKKFIWDSSAFTDGGFKAVNEMITPDVMSRISVYCGLVNPPLPETLKHANLDGIILRSTQFVKSGMSSFSRISMIYATVTEVEFVGCQFIGEETDFYETCFTKCVFRQCCIERGTTWVAIWSSEPEFVDEMIARGAVIEQCEFY